MASSAPGSGCQSAGEAMKSSSPKALMVPSRSRMASFIRDFPERWLPFTGRWWGTLLLASQ